MRPIKLTDGYPLQFGAMGWYSEENWNGIPTRWMPQNASLLIYADKTRPVTLQFRALSYHSEKTLVIYHDNTIGEETIPQHFAEIKVPLSLQKGMNVIHLQVLEDCDKPSKTSSTDNRCLSIAVQDVRLEEEEPWRGKLVESTCIGENETLPTTGQEPETNNCSSRQRVQKRHFAIHVIFGVLKNPYQEIAVGISLEEP